MIKDSVQNEEAVVNSETAFKMMEGFKELNSDLKEHGKILAERHKVSLEHMTEATLAIICNSCANLTGEIMGKVYKSRNAMNEIKIMVCKEVVERTQGKLRIPDYNDSNKSHPQVWLYIGTHWITIEYSRFIRFINSAMQKIGLKQEQYDNPNYAKSQKEYIEYKLNMPMPKRDASSVYCINLQNGTVEIDHEGNVELKDHDLEDGFTYVLPYVYDQNATCEKWQAFLDQMLPEKEAQNLFAEFCGYSLTNDIKGEKMLVLYGNGSNGESVALDVISEVYGDANVSNVPLDAVTKDEKARAMLQFKLVNISYESDKDIQPSVLKQAVSGEPLNAYINYIGPIMMKCYAKFITSFNIMPKAENTHGFYRRFIILPWEITIDKKNEDKELAKKITADELPGIFNWMLEGLKRFLKNKSFTHSELCEKAIEKYKLRSNSVHLFIETCCERAENDFVNGKLLFEAYKEFCIEEDIKPKGKQNFFDQVELLGYKKDKNQNNIRFNSIRIK